MNKKGFTLIELLAYLSLVGIIVTLFGGFMGYVFKSYDQINGKGAITNEANNIMSLIISRSQSFNPQYTISCGDNCIELVIENERDINEQLGIIEYVTVNKTSKLELNENNIYINNLKINSKQFAVIVDHPDFENSSEISQSCPQMTSELSNTCQKPIVFVRLVLVRVEQNGNILTKPGDETVFENRFSY